MSFILLDPSLAAVKFDLCHFAGPKTMSGRGRQKGAKEQGCHATL